MYVVVVSVNESVKAEILSSDGVIVVQMDLALLDIYIQ